MTAEFGLAVLLGVIAVKADDDAYRNTEWKINVEVCLKANYEFDINSTIVCVTCIPCPTQNQYDWLEEKCLNAWIDCFHVCNTPTLQWNEEVLDQEYIEILSSECHFVRPIIKLDNATTAESSVGTSGIPSDETATSEYLENGTKTDTPTSEKGPRPPTTERKPPPKSIISLKNVLIIIAVCIVILVVGSGFLRLVIIDNCRYLIYSPIRQKEDGIKKDLPDEIRQFDPIELLVQAPNIVPEAEEQKNGINKDLPDENRQFDPIELLVQAPNIVTEAEEQKNGINKDLPDEIRQWRMVLDDADTRDKFTHGIDPIELLVEAPDIVTEAEEQEIKAICTQKGQINACSRLIDILLQSSNPQWPDDLLNGLQQRYLVYGKLLETRFQKIQALQATVPTSGSDSALVEVDST